MDDVDDLVERFKRHELSAELLVRQVADLRRSELDAAGPASRADPVRVPHGTSVPRRLDLTILDEDGTTTSASNSAALQRAREALRKIDRLS